MKNLLGIAALVLLATVVTGREGASTPEVLSSPEVRPEQAVAVSEDLDIPKLIRERRSGNRQDLFAGQAPAPTPVAVVAPPPAVAAAQAVPVAPPLPYSYLGRMKNGERTIVYLRRNQQGMLIAESGATLDSAYMVDAISDTAVHFTYLPHGTKQVLNVPAAP
jgi:hypothetical protein